MRFYLWPDALRIYFFGAAVFLAVGFALAGHPRTAVFSFVWTAVLAPYVLFYLFRAPVLDCMHVLDRHPDGVGASGLAELRVAQVVPGFPGWRGFVPRPLIAVDTRLNDPEQSAYAALVASAVADFFSSRSESDGLCRRGYRRWFLYWASPVWTGYACLLAAYFDNATADGNLLDLSVVWTALSALYLFQQTCAFQRRAAHLDSLTLLRQRSMLVKLRLDFRDCPLHVRAPQLDRLLVQGANLIPAAVLTILPLMAQIWTMND